LGGELFVWRSVGERERGRGWLRCAYQQVVVLAQGYDRTRPGHKSYRLCLYRADAGG